MNRTYVLSTQEVRLRSLTHDEAVLLEILSNIPQRFVLRTMMVKLTYMIDVYASEHTGIQVSGFTYSWDNYGPNDQSNSIVKMLDRLAADGFISHEQFDNEYDAVTHLYGLEGRHYALALNPDHRILIERVVNEWSNRPLKEVVAASKNTAPMNGVKQGDTLSLLSDPKIAEFRDALRERYGDSIEQSVRRARALKADPGITVEQMEVESGQRNQTDRSS